MNKHWIAPSLAGLSLIIVACKNPTAPVNFQQSAVHIRPSWSKDGKTIAFSATFNSVTGIYLIDSSGTNIHLLHEGAAYGCTWSPDSRWLAYAEQGDLYKIKVTGDSVSVLTTSGLDYRPAWSLDGKKIAFTRQGVGVWWYDLQSATLTSVFETGDFPSWHSNGELVVLGQSYGGSYGTALNTFYAIRTDSLTWRSLNSFVTSYYCAFVSVNPNGTTELEIAFSLTPDNDYTEIWKMDLISGGFSQLTNDGADFPAWSPDGSKIAYTRTQLGDGALWIMNADGSAKHRLTTPAN